jgi:hypothetical protein
MTAMTKSLLLCLIWVSSLGAQTRELDRVLRTHVADGRVNYKALKDDPLFERSVQRLGLKKSPSVHAVSLLYSILASAILANSPVKQYINIYFENLGRFYCI